MQIFARTDMGKAREVNQDFYYVSDNVSGIKLYILADRNGGT